MKVSIKIPYARWFTIRRVRTIPESWAEILPSKRIQYFKTLWLDADKTALVGILKDILSITNRYVFKSFQRGYWHFGRASGVDARGFER
jgi:hypothetical protein